MTKFLNYKIVQLDDCTREAVRFFKQSGLIAILQKNGCVAMSATGIFNKPDSPLSRERVAICLYGLKLISKELLNTFTKAATKYRDQLDTVSLQYEAKRLGFKLEKKK